MSFAIAILLSGDGFVCHFLFFGVLLLLSSIICMLLFSYTCILWILFG